MSGEIVPFGKYKGKPIEAMAEDRQYLDWVTAQPWFRERYANIYTLIINNFQEPADTPEHNALQARFLDASFLLAFVKIVRTNFELGRNKLGAAFECEGFDVNVTGGVNLYIECKPVVGDDYPAILRQIRTAQNAPDVYYGNRTYYREQSRDAILFLEQYVGSGATLDQFVEIFERSGIQVVFLDEVLDSL